MTKQKQIIIILIFAFLLGMLRSFFINDPNFSIIKQKRKEIRSRIQIPAPYYINRGFLPETLDKFDVGFCSTPRKPMTGRVVVPVYNDAHEVMIGCVGRAVQPNFEPKWLNSKGFNSGASLYNYWHAKDHILESQVAKSQKIIISHRQLLFHRVLQFLPLSHSFFQL